MNGTLSSLIELCSWTWSEDAEAGAANVRLIRDCVRTTRRCWVASDEKLTGGCGVNKTTNVSFSRVLRRSASWHRLQREKSGKADTEKPWSAKHHNMSNIHNDNDSNHFTVNMMTSYQSTIHTDKEQYFDTRNPWSSMHHVINNCSIKMTSLKYIWWQLITY